MTTPIKQRKHQCPKITTCTAWIYMLHYNWTLNNVPRIFSKLKMANYPPMVIVHQRKFKICSMHLAKVEWRPKISQFFILNKYKGLSLLKAISYKCQNVQSLHQWNIYIHIHVIKPAQYFSKHGINIKIWNAVIMGRLRRNIYWQGVKKYTYI